MAEAPASYATADEYFVETREARTDAKTAQVTAKLAGASALIRSILPRGYEPDPIITRMVCIQAVQRAIINTGGRRYRQIGSTSEGYDEQSGLFITDAEREQVLAGYDSDSDGGTAYTIGLRDEAYLPDPRFGDPYCAGGW